MRISLVILLTTLLVSSSQAEPTIGLLTKRVELGPPVGTVEVITTWETEDNVSLLEGIEIKSEPLKLHQHFKKLSAVVTKEDFGEDGIKSFDLNGDNTKDLLIKTNHGQDVTSYRQFIFDRKNNSFTKGEEVTSPEIKSPSLMISQVGRWEMDEDFGYELYVPSEGGLQKRGEFRVHSAKTFPEYAREVTKRTGANLVAAIKMAEKGAGHSLFITLEDSGLLCLKVVILEAGKITREALPVGDPKSCKAAIARVENETEVNYEEFSQQE